MSFVDLLSALLVPREHGGERRILSRVAELGLRDGVVAEWIKAWR